MRRKLLLFTSISKILIFLVILIALLPFLNTPGISEKLVPSKGYVQKEEAENTTKATSKPIEPFKWTVEKVDEHITRIAIPPDPRMSTNDELFEAMNEYRKAHAVPLLQKSDNLCAIAQNRANEQLERGSLDNHEGFGKYVQGQNEFSRMGEVLFGGGQPQYGVHIVEYGWARSLTGHKEAIEDPSWQHGCGGIAGYYAVFIFGVK